MKIKVPQVPWQPSCWVGGLLVTSNLIGDNWLDTEAEPTTNMPDDCRAKYAAAKVTLATMRSMRK